MKFEEVLPALRDGKKIKRKPWNSDQYICLENGDNLPIYYVLEDDWEIVEESALTYDWDYIIKHKCLCWFFADDHEPMGIWKLACIKDKSDFKFVSNKGMVWKYCRPVCKEEVKFYEDGKDD